MARYSSGSSRLPPLARSASSLACGCSKVSEIYLREIRPRTTCLYSAASTCPHRASAAFQSVSDQFGDGGHDNPVPALQNTGLKAIARELEQRASDSEAASPQIPPRGPRPGRVPGCRPMDLAPVDLQSEVDGGELPSRRRREGQALHLGRGRADLVGHDDAVGPS